VTANLLPPQFLHQPVLVRAVNPLDSSLGLGRTRRNQLDPQPPIPPATWVLISAMRKTGIAFVFEYNEAMSDEIQMVIDPKQMVRAINENQLVNRLRPGY
jgi:hypothetical protein